MNPTRGADALLGSALLEAASVADLLHISVDTLAKWRRMHRGPEYFQISGKRVLYSPGAVERWLESRRRGGVANAPQGQERQGKGAIPPLPARAGRTLLWRFRRHVTR